jgi:aryl-alcohol dehydrogenase-like predicted oxidoreductase
MQNRAHAVLDAAWEAGVRYFDTSRSYGQAEAFLGSWLSARRIRPTDVVVGSKWGYDYTAGWKVYADRHEVRDHSLSALVRQHAESMALLGEFLRIYQIQWATLESGVLDDRDVLKELIRLKQDGLKVGLALGGPRQAETLRRAMKMTVGDSPLFDSVHTTWNLLEPSVGLVLEEAHEAGMGIIVKEVLANGRLTSRNDSPGFASRRTLFENAARQLHTTKDALAIAAALAQPWADIVLSGAVSVEQLHSNLAALRVEWDDNIGEELRPLAMTPEQYWVERELLPWN